jgi:hypothetical protein
VGKYTNLKWYDGERYVPRGDCPEIKVGLRNHDPDERGRCHWCRKKVGPGKLKPDKFEASEGTLSYEYFWDPDFGSGKYDIYNP